METVRMGKTLKISDLEIKKLVRDFEKENDVDIFWDHEIWEMRVMFHMRRGRIWAKSYHYIPYDDLTTEKVIETINEMYMEILEKIKSA